jgi:hypothetical protein
MFHVTNDVRREYRNLKGLFRRSLLLVCVLMSMTYTMAEVDEPLAEITAEPETLNTGQSVVEGIVSEESNAAAIDAESLDEDMSYKIYRQENPGNPCDRGLDTYDYEKQWYDNSQIYVNSIFCEPALWFDNYYATDRIFEEGVAGTYVRLRNDFIYDEEDGFEFKIRLKASFELPDTENRLRLTFSGDQDEDLRDIAPGNGEDASNSLGLQLDLAKTARSKFSVSGSLTPRIRFRYRYTYPIVDDITMRLTQEVQREHSTVSTRSRIDFEYLFEEAFLFRSSSQGEFSEDFDGVDWLQAFILYQRLSDKTSMAYETSVNGITEPRVQDLNYRVGVRYRKNFHREWLFYEIAPEYTWPITLDDQRLLVEKERRSKWLILFRLEIHFGNASKKRYQNYTQLR